MGCRNAEIKWPLSTLAFLQILIALLEKHNTALQETEKCLHLEHIEWVQRVQQPGSHPPGLLLWFTQLRSTENQCCQEFDPLSFISVLSGALLFLFPAHSHGQHLKLNRVSQKVVVYKCRYVPALESFFFPLFCLMHTMLRHFRIDDSLGSYSCWNVPIQYKNIKPPITQLTQVLCHMNFSVSCTEIVLINLASQTRDTYY